MASGDKNVWHTGTQETTYTWDRSGDAGGIHDQFEKSDPSHIDPLISRIEALMRFAGDRIAPDLSTIKQNLDACWQGAEADKAMGVLGELSTNATTISTDASKISQSLRTFQGSWTQLRSQAMSLKTGFSLGDAVSSGDLSGGNDGGARDLVAKLVTAINSSMHAMPGQLTYYTPLTVGQADDQGGPGPGPMGPGPGPGPLGGAGPGPGPIGPGPGNHIPNPGHPSGPGPIGPGPIGPGPGPIGPGPGPIGPGGIGPGGIGPGGIGPGGGYGPGAGIDTGTSLAGFDPSGAGGGGLGGGGGGLGAGSGGGGLGAGGLGAASGGLGSSTAGLGSGGGAAGGLGAAGGGVAGAGASGRGVGMMPMTGGGQGNGGQDRERSTWLAEDDDVWGGEDAPPGVIA